MRHPRAGTVLRRVAVALTPSLVAVACGDGDGGGATATGQRTPIEIPDVVVNDLHAGGLVNMRAVVPAELPTLVWFWAPH